MKDRKAGLLVHRRGWLLLLGVGLMILFCLFLFRSQTRGHVERSNHGETLLTNVPQLDLMTKVRKGHGLLIANPMVGRPTPDTVTLTAKANTSPVSLMLRLCKESQQKSICESDVLPIEFITWRPSTVVQYGLAVQARVEEKGADGSGRVLNLKKREYVEMTLLGLEPGTSYNWFLLVREITPFRLDVTEQEVFSGRFTTQRTSSSSSFTFDIFADPHLFSEQFSEQFKNHPERDKMLETFHAQKAQVEAEFLEVAKHINADKPDFIVGLGDPFDLHGLGFTPALSKEEAVLAHAHARRFFSVFNESGALFQVVGNWEGESGCHPADARQNAILARQIFQINPRPHTYHWHGSADEDYYAFSWGDMLAVVLNVLGYDETCHQMGQVFGSKKYGNYKSFTLGEQQQKFVEKTLTESKHAYKVVFIHHALAGRAKDPVNADYGRGGYLAAKTGGQRWLHDLMVETGVQIMFYGHDHVFTDGVVDNVHYTLPGTISAPWKFTSEETGYTKYNATSGHARVHVSPQDMTVEFVSIENKVIHSYQVKPAGKHSASGSAAI